MLPKGKLTNLMKERITSLYRVCYIIGSEKPITNKILSKIATEDLDIPHSSYYNTLKKMEELNLIRKLPDSKFQVDKLDSEILGSNSPSKKDLIKKGGLEGSEALAPIVRVYLSHETTNTLEPYISKQPIVTDDGSNYAWIYISIVVIALTLIYFLY